MSFLKRVQSQSSSTKAQYAFVEACLITGFIGVVWASTIPARFAQMTEEPLEEEKEPLGIIEVFEETKNQVGNIINWNTDAPVEEKEKTLSPDTALGALTTGDVSKATSTEEKTVVTPPRVEEVVITTTSTPETTNDAEKPIQPKVIIIATTTSQKSE